MRTLPAIVAIDLLPYGNVQIKELDVTSLN
jgi:hypothetical protein